MSTFQQLCESFYSEEHDEEDDIFIILRGLELQGSFWDDFLAVIGNNQDAASEFFNVDRDKIAQWSAKIKKAVKQAKDNPSDKAKMLNTGI